MSIRLPLTTVLDSNNTTEEGAGIAGAYASVAGGIAYTFLVPQDCDNVVVKYQVSVAGAGMSAIFQTSDNGGTTYYDVARTSIVSNANAAVTAEWLSVPVIGAGMRPQAIDTIAFGSVAGRTTGRAAASTLGQGQYNGLPLLGRQNRIFVIAAAGITSVISQRITVSANSQSLAN